MIEYDDLFLSKAVVEIRYRKGWRYLDKCGEALLAIEATGPGWIVDTVNPQGGIVHNPSKNLHFGFSPVKMDLTQDEVLNRNTEMLAEEANRLFEILTSVLGVKSFSRIGVRFWYLYRVESLKLGEDILSRNAVFSVNKSIEGLFGVPLTNTSFVAVLGQGNAGCRVSVSTVKQVGDQAPDSGVKSVPLPPPHKLKANERKAALLDRMRQEKFLKEHLPPFAILVDVDNYENEPKVVNPKDYILSSAELMKKVVPFVLSSTQGG